MNNETLCNSSSLFSWQDLVTDHHNLVKYIPPHLNLSKKFWYNTCYVNCRLNRISTSNPPKPSSTNKKSNEYKNFFSHSVVTLDTDEQINIMKLGLFWHTWHIDRSEGVHPKFMSLPLRTKLSSNFSDHSQWLTQNCSISPTVKDR